QLEKKFLGNSGIISKDVHSPNFPNAYGLSMHCEWDIEAPPGYHADISIFHDVDDEHPIQSKNKSCESFNYYRVVMLSSSGVLDDSRVVCDDFSSESLYFSMQSQKIKLRFEAGKDIESVHRQRFITATMIPRYGGTFTASHKPQIIHFRDTHFDECS
ncbi:hypothetical protein PFISCL1PPCAC_12562, partial [Pristionchus fissidentatus]